MTPSNPIKLGDYWTLPFDRAADIGAKVITQAGDIGEFLGRHASGGTHPYLIRFGGSTFVCSCNLEGDLVTGGQVYMLTAEPPDPIAPGHNPHKLLQSQIPAGWRLLKDLNEPFDKRAKFWAPNRECFMPYLPFALEEANYPKGDTTIIPTSPPKRIPLTPADFPPGTAIRMVGWELYNGYDLVICASGTSVWTGSKRVHDYNNHAFMNMYQRLLPGTTEWLPCYREE